MIAAIILLIALTGCSSNNLQDKWETTLRHSVENYIKTGEKSDELTNVLQKVDFSQLFLKKHSRLYIESNQSSFCSACEIAIGAAIAARRYLGIEKEILAVIVVKLCTLAEIDHPDVCQAFVDQNLDIMLYAVDNKPHVTEKTFCALFLQEFHCRDPERVNWTVNVPPRTMMNHGAAEKSTVENKSIKLLHLTDIHYDPGYGIDSNAECDFRLCCQAGSVPARPEDAAGYWGDYRSCDTPDHAVVDILSHVTTQHKDIEFIYYTGDVIKHKDWANNISDNTQDLTTIFQAFKESFGNLPVYPILGNHDPYPTNQFSSEGINSSSVLSTQWVFDVVAKLWQMWLPNETEETILRGGYYTVLARPGLRVIALNNNVAFTTNLWLLNDDVDPFGQLQWLVDTLVEAERNDEKVHILSHIPSNDMTCFQNWASEYRRIIDRFSHVIAAQFTGHTHFDETVIYFSSEDPSKAINIAFNGGSATTYANLNPNYKTYEIDSATFDVLNYESWMYNITEANVNAPLPPRWYKLYDFKSAYNVSSLNPQDIALLAERMAMSPALTQAYFRYKHREADPELAFGCNANCELENLCLMVSSLYGDDYHCNIYTEIFNNRPH